MWNITNVNLEYIRQIANSANTILITGKTGTGKSYLANEIHSLSTRRSAKFVTINLASLHEGLIESELFGHERGAFTGADGKRIGRLEYANGGTVFLDEIGELSLKLQSRLLDTLNGKVITPVGSNREIKLDIKIIAATNRNLKQMVKDKEFREDLFYRLNTFQIEMPDLYNNPDSLESLAIRFLNQARKEQGKESLQINSDFTSNLKKYNWPGNIRELKNAMEYVAATTSTESPAYTNLPAYIIQNSSNIADSKPIHHTLPMPCNYYEYKEITEKQFLIEMLRRFDGKINETSRKTKLSKVTLIEKIRKYNIDVKTIKFENFINERTQVLI